MQVSPATTVYATGGSGVGVGTGVSVPVGRGVKVGGSVAVAEGVGVLRLNGPMPFTAPKISPTPPSASRPTRRVRSAVERLTTPAPVRPGRRPELPRAARADRSAPHTRHLVAAAPTRVPHVGQRRGSEEGGADDRVMGQNCRERYPGECAHYTMRFKVGVRVSAIFWLLYNHARCRGSRDG